MKTSPFRTQKTQIDIVRIGDEATGFMYLAKRGGVTPKENPADVELDNKAQAELTVTLLRAVKNCAQQDGISQKAARKKIFPEKASEPATKSAADSSAIVATSNVTVVDDEPDLYDYLSPEEAGQLIMLQQGAVNRTIRIATNLIRSRIAYPIVITAEAKAKSNLLQIKPLNFQVAIGNKFRRANGEIIEITEEALLDAGELVVVPLTQTIECDEVAYLLDVTGKIKIGDPDWTDEHTEDLLLETHVAMLCDFYDAEANAANPRVAQDDTEGNLTNKLPDSPNTSTPTQSTGSRSTGASKVTA